MAELLQMPSRVVTAEAPRTSLSTSEVAAPYRDLAHGLDKAGEALESFSVDQATEAGKEAGRKSVHTDASGNLVVDDTRNWLLVGPAATAYSRTARMTAVARAQPEIESDLLKLRLEHANDPQGFQAAAKAYGRAKINGDEDNGTPAIRDPHVAGAIGDMIATNAAHNYRGLLESADRQQTAEAFQTYQARLKDLNEQSQSLARQGGTNTPEYLALQKNRVQFYKELAGDQRFKFSAERAELELKEAESRDIVQQKIGEAQRLFQTKRNAGEAQAYLQKAFWGPGSEKLNLTATQRDHGVSEGLHALANLSAQDREAISENRQAVTGYVKQLEERPGSFDDIQHNNLVQRARDIGDDKSLEDLRWAKAMQPVWRSLKGMGPDERAAALQQMDRGIVPGVAPADRARMTELGGISGAFFAERGGSARFAGTNPEFAGRLRTAIEAAEAATGEKATINSLRRTSEEQAAAYARYLSGAGGLAAPPGSSRHEVGEAADIKPGRVLNWLHQHAQDYGLEFLKGQAFYKDPVHIQMAGGLQPGSRIDLSASNAAARMFENTVKSLRGQVSQDADKQATEILDRIKTGNAFEDGQVERFARVAALAGRSDLIEKVEPAMRALDLREKLPEGTSAAVLHAAVEAAQAQGLPTVERHALNMLDDQFKRDYGQMHAEPLVYGGKAEWFPPVGQLDTANPQAFGAELSDRQTKIGIAQNRIRDLGPVSAIGPGEAGAVAKALTDGPADAAAGILSAIRGNLMEDDFRATMDSKPMVEAVSAMAWSNDPVRARAGFQAMDRLWGTNPSEFERAYGEHAKERLMAWKGLDGLTDDQKIERLNRADDPFQAKGRKEVEATVQKEFKDTTAADVAYQIGTSFGIPIVSRVTNIVTGATAAPPESAVAAGAMVSQWKETVATLRAYDVTPDQAKRLAVQAMRSQWQPSNLVTSNTLMKHAPEAHYPQVDGSHDWMRDQLEADATKVLGPKFQFTSLEGATTTFPGWQLKGILSDEQTEREIAQGRPPSYRIHVVDANGQDQFLKDAAGSDRYVWNPAPVQSAYQGGQQRTFDRSRRMNQPAEPSQPAMGGFATLGQAKPFMAPSVARDTILAGR